MTTANPDPAHALTPTGNLRRRLAISRIFQTFAVGSAALAVGVLILLIVIIIGHGASNLSWSFLTGNLPNGGYVAGGIGPALVGTLETALIAVLIAVPLGVFTALLVNEFAGSRISALLTAILELMTGIPHIVIGLFIYGAVVESMGTGSGLAGSLALAVIMTPVIARSTIESFQRVPGTWREASTALGIARWRAVTGLVLPAASSGIVTASILATARAAGDAAPLLLTSNGFTNSTSLNPLKPMATLPILIYNEMVYGTPQADQVAWGGALVLILIILFVNIGARILLRRGERKRGL